MRRTNRILPVYSADISGVCSALYELGGMTVMHDASGCNSTYTTHDEPRWYSMDSMVYISALSELEAVMGDDGKLVRDIVDAARNLHPKFICIGGTPIPMMMGTDFKGIARMIEAQTNIPAFGISTNGMHSYVQGAGEALRWIAKRFCPLREELADAGIWEDEGAEKPGTMGRRRLRVNILGATPLDFSLTGNVARMKDFLKAQGMEIVSCWAMESSLEELRLAGTADVNLVVSGVGLPAARQLREMYKTPYVTGIPVGRKTALRLADLMRRGAESGGNQSLFATSHDAGRDGDASAAFGAETAAHGAETAAPGAETAALGAETADLGLDGLPENLAGERILLIGEQIMAGSLRCSLREDFGAKDVTVLCPTEGEKSLAEEGDLLDWDEDEVISRIKESTVVIADPIYRLVCSEDSGVVFVNFPHEACSGRMYHDSMKPFVCGGN